MCLPHKAWWTGGQLGRRHFSKILKTKIDKETSIKSPLSQAVNASVNLLKSLESPQFQTETTDRREIYTEILCASAVQQLSMKDAIENLSAGGELIPEEPSIGALIVATALGDIPLMKALIAQGSDVNEESSFFGNAFEAAGLQGQYEAGKFLIENCRPYPGYIYSAIRGGNEDLVQLYLNKFRSEDWYTEANPGGNSSYENLIVYQREFMLRVAACADLPALVDIFIKFWPQAERESILQVTLCHALEYHSTSTFTYLLEKGVNLNGRNSELGNAFHIASRRGDLEIVRLLFKYGFWDQNGVLDSCMHLAATMGHTDIVQLFLDKGVDVNCKWTNQLHGSPWDDMSLNDLATLHAAQQGDFHMFCFLVRRGAVVKLEGELGPLQKRWLDKIHAWEVQNAAIHV